MSHKITEVDPHGNTVVYEWNPRPDIKTHELALCMPIFSTRIDSGSEGHCIVRLPDMARRHFTKVG